MPHCTRFSDTALKTSDPLAKTAQSYWVSHHPNTAAPVCMPHLCIWGSWKEYDPITSLFHHYWFPQIYACYLASVFPKACNDGRLDREIEGVKGSHLLPNPASRICLPPHLLSLQVTDLLPSLNTPFCPTRPTFDSLVASLQHVQTACAPPEIDLAVASAKSRPVPGSIHLFHLSSHLSISAS